jgi:hypothetical protein
MFEHFCRPYIAAYDKAKAKNKGLDLDSGVETSCTLGHTYDADIHCAIAHLRILDGSLPVHPTHGRSVNFFADVGRPKYWFFFSGLRPPRQPLDFSYITRLTRLCAHSWPRSLECQSGIPPTRPRWTHFWRPKSKCMYRSFVQVVQV